MAIFLCKVMKMEKILNFLKRLSREKEGEEPLEVESEKEKLAREEIQEEIVAVITAAISAYMEGTDQFYITSIKATDTYKPLWSLVGRIEQMQARSVRRYW